MHLLRSLIDERSNPRRSRHQHPGPELLVIEEGTGTQLTQHGEETCRPGDVFVFPQRIPHLSYAAAGQRFSCLVLQTDPGDFADGRPGDGGADLLHHIAEVAGRGNRLILRPPTCQQVRTRLRQALAEQQSRAAGARCAARLLVMDALVAIARDPGQPQRADQAAADRHVEEAMRWIGAYFMTPIRLPDLIALGPLGRSQFLARFRMRTGRTVGAEILAVRLAEAQRLLQAGGHSMLDIALACGFGSQSHFNHSFRAAIGVAPSQWRP